MTKVCKIEGCQHGASRLRRGMCNTHYLRVMRYGDPLFRKKAANGEVSSKSCLVDGCGRQAKAKDYCGMHFQRIKRHGDPLLGVKQDRLTGDAFKAMRARAQKRYRETPHGKLRTRYNVSKMRTMGNAQIGIPKHQFERLWATLQCALCGGSMADSDKSLDHKTPLSRGGDNSLANLQIAHLSCNQRKSNNSYPL